DEDLAVVVLVPDDSRTRRAEQARDLVADRREDLDGADGLRHQRRHPPQRGLLFCELAGSRLGGGELGAALGVRDRRRYELGELGDAFLGVRWEAAVRVVDSEDAPELALYHDRGGDRGN